jgi:hypothetical protein
MKISFFPRNKRQKMLWSGTAAILSEKSYETYLILPKLGIGTERSFFPEQEASDLIVSGEVNYDLEFARIVRQYSNVNRIIQSERELNYFPFYFGDEAVSREKKIQLCCAFFIVFERYIKRISPQIIVSEMVLGLFDGILYEVAKKNNVVYLGVRPSKISPGIVFCDSPFDTPIFLTDKINRSRELSNLELRKQVLEIVHASVHPKKLPHYMVRSSKTFSLFSLRVFRAALRLLLQKVEIPQVSIYQHTKLNSFREALTKRRNISGWRFNDDHVIKLCSATNYFVYAAHFEPEASVSIRSFNFSDQLGLIKLISKLLPADCVLVVKEHRGNQGFRKPQFYRELSHHYNIVCASPKMNLRELVQGSKGVVTLTGRVGLEALIDDIPVIAFGKTFWSDNERVYKPQSPQEIKKILYELTNQKLDIGIENGLKFNQSLCELILGYHSCTFPGSFIQGADEFTSLANSKDYADALLNISNQLKSSKIFESK